MKIEEAVEVMNTGKIVLSQSNCEFKLQKNTLFMKCRNNSWIICDYSIRKLCNMHFRLKDEPIILSSKVIKVEQVEMTEIVLVDDLKETIKQIKDEVFKLYKKSEIDDIIEIVDKHLGDKFTDMSTC